MKQGWFEPKQTFENAAELRRRGHLLIALSGASFLAMANPARAQTDAAVSPAMSGDGGEIVVTAQRRGQAVSRVGIAITALSGDTLIEKGIASAEELWRITPGLIVKDAGFGVPNYTLRGVGFENYFVNSSSTVGLYANEVAIPYPVMSRGTFFDLDRVEVLKGPQGDLYGRNTTAGQINLIDRKPTPEFAVGGVAEFGRFNDLNVQAYVSGPLANNIQGRLSGVVNTSDGWQRSLSRPNDKLLGAKDQVGLRGQINFDIAPESTFLVRAYWNRDRSDNTASTPVDGRELEAVMDLV